VREVDHRFTEAAVTFDELAAARVDPRAIDVISVPIDSVDDPGVVWICEDVQPKLFPDISVATIALTIVDKRRPLVFADANPAAVNDLDIEIPRLPNLPLALIDCALLEQSIDDRRWGSRRTVGSRARSGHPIRGECRSDLSPDMIERLEIVRIEEREQHIGH